MAKPKKEVESFLYYGEHKGEKIDEDGRIDRAMEWMFYQLKHHSVFDSEKVEAIFWCRLEKLQSLSNNLEMEQNNGEQRN